MARPALAQDLSKHFRRHFRHVCSAEWQHGRIIRHNARACGAAIRTLLDVQDPEHGHSPRERHCSRSRVSRHIRPRAQAARRMGTRSHASFRLSVFNSLVLRRSREACRSSRRGSFLEAIRVWERVHQPGASMGPKGHSGLMAVFAFLPTSRSISCRDSMKEESACRNERPH